MINIKKIKSKLHKHKVNKKLVQAKDENNLINIYIYITKFISK